MEDIAEPLRSFDQSTPVTELAAFMQEMDYRVVGVRHQGILIGHVDREQLVESSEKDLASIVKPFPEELVLDAGTGYEGAIDILNDSQRAFVEVFGKVGGIITRTDLSKPPVRMWLFGMITIIEMGLLKLIEEEMPNGAWMETLSPSRLEKAKELQGMRVARSQQLDLLDCLQFADKGTIIAKAKKLRDRFEFPSRRKAEDLFKDLESLRNGLAHSNDIIAQDWDAIVRLAANIERIVSLVS
ncbi:MAG: hypothetical protein ACKVH8_12385 [Pirellulales bacterium]